MHRGRAMHRRAGDRLALDLHVHVLAAAGERDERAGDDHLDGLHGRNLPRPVSTLVGDVTRIVRVVPVP